MKKRINLLGIKREKKFFYSNKLIFYTTVLGFIFFIIFLYLSNLQVNLRKQLNNLNNDKQANLNYLLENKDTEAKLRYFKTKQTQLNRYIQDDVNFLPYYSLLKETISTSSESAAIGSIIIDKNKETEFVVNFSDYPSIINFLNYAEAEEFLKNFTKLSLTNFDLLAEEGRDSYKSYELKFKGKFKPINENNL